MLHRSAYVSIRSIVLISVCVAGLVVSGCRKKSQAAPPMATPSVSLSRDKVPLGSPIDITYKFVVANDAHEQFTVTVAYKQQQEEHL